MKQWLRERLREPSTYKGISLLLAAMGVGVAPEHIGALITAAAALWGSVDVVRREQ